MAVVTISRLEASRGNEVAAAVARRLGFRLVDRTLMKELIYSYDLLSSIGKLEGEGSAGGNEDQIRSVTEGIIYHLAFQEDIVLLGHGGQFLFRGCPSSFHVRLQASLAYRLNHVTDLKKGSPEAVLERRERKRRRLVKRSFGADLERSEHYDLVLTMDAFGVEGATDAVVGAAEMTGISGGGDLEEIRAFGQRRGAKEIILEPLPSPAAGEVLFAHPSEAEFARVLDFYRIRWEYEPTSFPVDWWPDGRVRESFTPDFFLPDLDTFLELTTMKQSLVTKKNRKIRRFRELYPDRKLNIFYARDYRKLAQKYGLE
jgi:cytidylate kinase